MKRLIDEANGDSPGNGFEQLSGEQRLAVLVQSAEKFQRNPFPTAMGLGANSIGWTKAGPPAAALGACGCRTTRWWGPRPRAARLGGDRSIR